MTLEEFVDLVAKTRDAQRRFFRGDRSTAHLEYCRALERQVDAAVKELRQPARPGLFDAKE